MILPCIGLLILICFPARLPPVARPWDVFYVQGGAAAFPQQRLLCLNDKIGETALQSFSGVLATGPADAYLVGLLIKSHVIDSLLSVRF